MAVLSIYSSTDQALLRSAILAANTVAAATSPASLGVVAHAASPFTMAAPGFYGSLTSGGAFSMVLPAISTLAVGTVVRIYDLSNNAGTNNITVTGSGSDLILNHATSAASYVIDINNVITDFVVTAGGWRAISYGG